MTFVAIILIIGVVVAVGYILSTANDSKEQEQHMSTLSKDIEKVSFTVPYDSTHTIDIVSSYFRGTTAKGAILLHMMPSTKESWDEFSKKLYSKGYHVIAIDERGHGESIVIKDSKGVGTSISYKDFTEKEQIAKEHDVSGAYSYLIEQGVRKEEIVIVGASIGANLTVTFMESHPEISKGVSLYPGIDYHGVHTDTALRNMSSTQKVYLAASEGDKYSFESVNTLTAAHPSKVITKIFEGNEHGTNIFDKHPEFMDELIYFLEGK